MSEIDQGAPELKGIDVATYRVSNQGQLNSAVLDVRGGDTILLEGGRYGDLTLDALRGTQRHVDFGQKVTIASVGGERAQINEVMFRGVSNVELKNVTLDYNPSQSGGNPFTFEDTSRVTLNGVTFDGHSSGSYGTGRALALKKSADFSLINSEVVNFANGVGLASSRNVTIANTDFRQISKDAIIAGGLNGVRIENNDFRNIKANPNDSHNDIIQFYTSGAERASSNIVIRGNTIDTGEQIHGMYFGNALARGGAMGEAYRNVVIENNDVRTAHVHGITIDHGANVSIRNNVVQPNDDLGHTRMVNIPLINVSKSSSNVTITGNKVTSVPDEASGSWNVSGNSLGSKSVIHWDGAGATARASGGGGSPRPVEVDAPSGPAPIDEDDDDQDVGGGSGGGGSTGGSRVVRESADGVFRIDGRNVDGGDRFTVDMDLDGRDDFVFLRFDEGTFNGKPGGNRMDFWDDRGSVKIDSALDIRELDAHSSAVSASTSGDDVVVRVRQDDGEAQFLFADLADEFRAANQPELF